MRASSELLAGVDSVLRGSSPSLRSADLRHLPWLATGPPQGRLGF